MLLKLGIMALNAVVRASEFGPLGNICTAAAGSKHQGGGDSADG